MTQPALDLTSAAAIEVQRCNWCSRWLPRFRSHRLASNQVICDYCLEWHFQALDVLGGAIPRGCQGCGKTGADLRAITLDADVRFYAVPKDGIYQLLCRECVKPYMPKRADLYRGTQAGKDMRL
jgi:hypothetical protein